MKAIDKIIKILKENPKAYIIDWCEGEAEYDLVKSDSGDPEDNLQVSPKNFHYLKDNGLIEWQTDTDQWGDRYRLK